MPRRLLMLLGVCGLAAAVTLVEAQQTPAPPATPQPLLAPSGTQLTPPVAPKTQETPIPPPVTIPAPPLPADVPNRPLTATEAAQVALRRQPEILAARAAIISARGVTQQVRSGLYPTLTLNGSYTNVSVLNGSGAAAATGTGNTTGVGTTGGTGSTTGSGTTGGTTTVTPLGATSTGVQPTGFLATAAVRQLIFDFNHTRDLVRQSAALENVANQNLTTTQYTLILQVKQAFYTYIQDLGLVTVNEEDVANRQAELALARARLNSGLGLPSDVVTAETAVSSAVLNLNVARNNADLARVNLASLMGVDPRTPIAPAATGEPAFPSNDVNALVTQALTRRPEILAAQAAIKANQYGLSAARTTNAPVISGNLGVTSRGTDFPPNNDTFSIGASITFSPFDGGLTAGRVEQAKGELIAAQAQLASTQLTVTSDVSQAYFNLRTAEQRVTTANIELANATEGVRIAEGRYRSGLGLFQDILTAQAQLLTARTDLVNAQGAVEQARAAINRAIGNPLASTAPTPL